MYRTQDAGNHHIPSFLTSSNVATKVFLPYFLVPRVGLEPTRISPLASKTRASTNFATWAGVRTFPSVTKDSLRGFSICRYEHTSNCSTPSWESTQHDMERVGRIELHSAQLGRLASHLELTRNIH